MTPREIALPSPIYPVPASLSATQPFITAARGCPAPPPVGTTRLAANPTMGYWAATPGNGPSY